MDREEKAFEMIGGVCAKVNRHALLSLVLFGAAVVILKNEFGAADFVLPILGVSFDDTPTAVVLLMALAWGNGWLLWVYARKIKPLAEYVGDDRLIRLHGQYILNGGWLTVIYGLLLFCFVLSLFIQDPPGRGGPKEWIFTLLVLSSHLPFFYYTIDTRLRQSLELVEDD